MKHTVYLVHGVRLDLFVVRRITNAEPPLKVVVVPVERIGVAGTRNVQARQLIAILFGVATVALEVLLPHVHELMVGMAFDGAGATQASTLPRSPEACQASIHWTACPSSFVSVHKLARLVR